MKLIDTEKVTMEQWSEIIDLFEDADNEELKNKAEALAKHCGVEYQEATAYMYFAMQDMVD